MLWILLSCTIGYQEDGDLKSISVEQTHSVHHYNYDKSLKSSLRIVSMDDQLNEIGHGSGNYFKIGKHHFILTAAHVISEPSLLFIDDGELFVGADVVHMDPNLDIAILSVRHKLSNSKPIEYRINNKSDLTGMTVVYSGYPADLNKSVFNGMVSRCSEFNFIMQSFALPGASGSVIFDNNGKVLGVLSAIKMGLNPLSPFPQMHPSLVYVTRLKNYSRKSIKELLVKWKSSK